MTEMNKSTMRNLLHEIKKVAEHGSMTGSLKKGTPMLVDVYNRCLSVLKAGGDELVGEIFQELDKESTQIDTVGAAAALLNAYLAPEPPRHDPHTLHEKFLHEKMLPHFGPDMGPGKHFILNVEEHSEVRGEDEDE